MCEEEEAPGIPYQKEAKNGGGKKFDVEPKKAEVWGAYNLKCKNTEESPQKFRGKSQGIC